MKLTTKGKFAVTALLDIALNSNNLPTTLLVISNRHSISVSYLEQLFVKLRRAKIVKSYKGPGGGYVLAKPANMISISEIIKSVNDDMDARTCHGMKNCRGKNKCLAHDLWDNLTDYVYNYLDKITLTDVINDMNKENTKAIKFAHKI